MIARRLDRDVPVRMRVVHHEVIPPFLRGRDDRLETVLLDAVNRIEGIEYLRRVADDQ